MTTTTRHALTDDALERDIARALAVDPSPEFVARVRTRIANEPAPSAWRSSWTMAFAGAFVTALVLAVVLLNRQEMPVVAHRLAARAVPSDAATLPYVESAFRRTSDARGSTGSPRAGIEFARPELVDQPRSLSRTAVRRRFAS